jgi:ribosomal protein S18 acetylase RimI-like enzyme
VPDTINNTELPVQKQLEAYNARDIGAFMQYWVEDCQYYEFPSKLLANGAAEIRARHLIRFKEPNLCGALINRITVGNIVVDQEIVTRTFPDGPGEIDVLAIYEIERGKIAKAWFKMGTPRLHASDGLSLRQATPDDAAAIRTLTREAYAKWVALLGREPLPMTADYGEAVKNHRIDLLERNGSLVALIELAPKPDHLLIENIAVLPECQGRGLGRMLLSHAERVAAELGRSEIKLYTNKHFAENIALYQRAGYRIDREEPFKGGFTVYMSKIV